MVPKPRSKYTNGDKKLLFMNAEYFILFIEQKSIQQDHIMQKYQRYMISIRDNT